MDGVNVQLKANVDLADGLPSSNAPIHQGGLMHGVHSALAKPFRIPAGDRNQILHEHNAEDFESAKGPNS